MPRPQPQQRATSDSCGHKEDSERWHGTCFDDGEDESEDSHQQEHYSRCDSSSQYKHQTRHDQSRDWHHTDQGRPHYEEREYDTFSRDTNNRGRSLLTTSRSEEHSEATFNYSNVRIKDQQAATRSDYSDLLGHSSGGGCASRATGYRYGTNTTSKVQVFNSTPPNRNPPPGTHKDRRSGLATWSFQASVTPAEDIRLVQTKDSSYERTSGCDRDWRVFTCSGDRDFEKKCPSDQRSGSWWSPAKAGEITIMMTTTNVAGSMITNPILLYQLEQRTKTGMQTLTKLNPLQRGHIICTKPIRVVPPNLMTIPCHMTTILALLNLNLEVTWAVNNSPVKTPHMLNYETASSLKKKKISYCKGELKPACLLKLPLQRHIKRCHHLLHPNGQMGLQSLCEQDGCWGAEVPWRASSEMRGVESNI